MVVRNRAGFNVEDGAFQRRLKLLVMRTLPIVMASGALLLTDCGPINITTEPAKELPSKSLEEFATEPPGRREFVASEPPGRREVVTPEEPRSYQEVLVVDGRRPDGLVQACAAKSYDDLEDSEVLSALFAQSAYLELAAVVAFDHLARELEAYNAPTGMIKVALEAVDEEVEHARLMTQLAAHFGSAVVPEVKVAPFNLRPLHEIACENALEGCTRETYGALKALWQAETAASPEVREVAATVGHDESRHAALSWAIDAWARPQLTDAQRDVCDRVRTEGLAELRKETNRPVHPTLLKWAGYPSPQAAGLLLQESFTA